MAQSFYTQNSTPWYVKAAHAINLPDFGLTEKTQGINYYNSGQMANWPQQTPAASQGYSSPIGPTQPAYQPNSYKQTTPAPRTNTTANTGVTTSGGVKGTNVANQPNQLTAEQQAIEDMYAPTMDWLNSQIGNIGNQYNQNRDFYQSYFNPQYEQLNAARTTAQNLNAQNQQAVQKDTQSALDLANRTYTELNQRNQQMYGGMSSAGQFGSEIQGRELQGNVATATNTGAENMATLKNQLVDIESNYNTQKQAIDQQKTQTLLELQQGFENQLSEIDRQKASISGSKATDKLNALREFNAQKQAIEDQGRSLLQQLGANALAAQQQIQSSLAQYQAQAGSTPDLNAIPGMEYSQYLPTVDQSGEVVNPLLSLKRRQELGLA